MRMNAAETSASRAIADCTPLTVVSRSLTTDEIETFISDVSTTRTNIAIASRAPSRPGPAASSGALMIAASVTSGRLSRLRWRGASPRPGGAPSALQRLQRGVDRGEDAVVAERVEQARARRALDDRHADVGEDEVDAGALEGLGQLDEDLGARDVEVVVGADVEHHRARRRVGLADEQLDPVADRRGVRVEHRRLEAQDEYVGQRLRVGVALDGDVGVLDARQVADDRQARAA